MKESWQTVYDHEEPDEILITNRVNELKAAFGEIRPNTRLRSPQEILEELEERYEEDLEEDS